MSVEGKEIVLDDGRVAAAVVIVNKSGVITSIGENVTPTTTGKTASATSITLIAENVLGTRKGLRIDNSKSTSDLFVNYSATASIASGGFVDVIPAGGNWNMPENYQGVVSGIWTTASGYANVTELN